MITLDSIIDAIILGFIVGLVTIPFWFFLMPKLIPKMYGKLASATLDYALKNPEKIKQMSKVFGKPKISDPTSGKTERMESLENAFKTRSKDKLE